MVNRAQREEAIQEALEEAEADINVPWLYRWTKVSHYYGDSVRAMFITAAAIMLILAPFYTDNLSSELPFIVVGTVVLVCVAALTNPVKRGAISADAVAAGIGLVVFEMWALAGYQDAPMHKFVIREALAIIFLFALYFSTKTLRNMFLGQVGQIDIPSELGGKKRFDAAVRERVAWKKEAREALEEKNDREKVDFND